jgi:hypothetical protein
LVLLMADQRPRDSDQHDVAKCMRSDWPHSEATPGSSLGLPYIRGWLG